MPNEGEEVLHQNKYGTWSFVWAKWETCMRMNSEGARTKEKGAQF